MIKNEKFIKHIPHKNTYPKLKNTYSVLKKTRHLF